MSESINKYKLMIQKLTKKSELYDIKDKDDVIS